MGKFRKKTVTAGPLVYESIYPLPNPRDSAAVRQGKKNLTKSAQERMNLKYQWQKLECLLASNFRVNDLVVTLTFTDANLPHSREEVKNRVKQFFKQLRKIRAQWSSVETKYIYVIEHNHYREDPTFTPGELAQQGRYHVHMILNATGSDYGDILDAWPCGLTEVHPFEINHDRTYETLARYFCKEIPDYLGQRKFIPSQGLKRPETDYTTVDSKTVLIAPKDSTVYDNTGRVQTEYGAYQYIKYVWPKLIDRAPTSRKKKRRRMQSGKRK